MRLRVLKDAAALQEQNAFANPIDFAKVVRGEQDRGALLGVSGQDIRYLRALGRVEAFGDLVEHANGDVGGHRGGEDQLALHAVAVVADLAIQGQPKLAGQCPGPLARRPIPAAKEPVQVLGTSGFAVDPHFTRRIGQALANVHAIAAQADAIDVNLALVRSAESDQAAHQGALAAAVGSDQPHDRRGRHIQIQGSQCLIAAKGLGETPHMNSPGERSIRVKAIQVGAVLSA